MLNSYNHKNNPILFKKWSPGTSFEELHQRKREREDEYIKKIYAQDRPVLLIKEKHLYTDVEPLNQTDVSYFKVSENTAEVDDIDKEIRDQENFIRRHTLVHGVERPTFQVDDDPTAVYKIDGIEFLPEGFLELDPLLYKDEYTFDNEVNEKIFKEQQMKTKMMRRKQYWQKNQQKVRDVTIYVVDEHKSMILEYLDKWYFEHKRKMDDNEIEAISKDLNVEKNKMIKLQNLYLEKKKLDNTQRLSSYLNEIGSITDNKLHIPASLKKYFVKTKVKNDLAPVLDKNKSPYMKAYLQKYGIKKLKKPFASRIDPVQEENSGNDNNDDESVHKSKISSKNGLKSLSSLPKTKSVTEYKKLNSLKSFKKHGDSLKKGKLDEEVSSKKDLKATGSQISNKQSSDPELQNYFSNQIKDIFDRLETIEAADEDNNKDEGRIPNTSNNQPIFHEHYENTMEQQLRILIRNSQSRHTSLLIDKVPHIITSTNGPVDEQEEIVDIIGLPRQSTIIVNKKNGSKLIVCKLTPTMILTDYYFHCINEYIEKDGSRKATFTTKNENGDIMKEKEISHELLGNYYDTLVRFGLNDKDDSKSVQIVVCNEKGEEVVVEEINTTRFTCLVDDHYANLVSICDIEGRRRSTVRVEKTNNLLVKKYTLKPMLIGSMYYQQIIEEVFDDRGPKKAVVIIKDEEGKVVLLEEIPTDDMVDEYYAELMDDAIDRYGKRKTTLAIMNNKKEVVKQIDIHPTIMEAIGNQHIDDMIDEVFEEIVDGNKNSRITVLLVDGTSEKILYQEYRPSLQNRSISNTNVSRINTTFIVDNHFGNVIENIMENIRQRKTTVIRPKSISVDKQTIEDYLNKLKEGLVIDYEPARAKTISRKPTYICAKYYLELINDRLLEDENSDPEITMQQLSNNDSMQYKVSTLAANHLNELTDELVHQIERRQSVAERRKTSIRPSRMNEDSRKTLIESIRRHSSAVTNIRPTIVGEDYYGHIINEMLLHPNNQILINQSDEVILYRPSLIANDHYQDLVEEVNLHRKRLLTGSEVMAALNDSSSYGRHIDFKELEERYTIEILYANDEHNQDETFINECIKSLDVKNESGSIDVNEKLLNFDDIQKETINISKKVSMKKRLMSKPNELTYITEDGEFKSFEEVADNELGITKDELFNSFNDNRQSVSKNEIQNRESSLDKYESFIEPKKDDHNQSDEVFVKISDRGSHSPSKLDESKTENRFQSFGNKGRLTNLTLPMEVIINDNINQESKLINDRFQSVQDNNSHNDESKKDIQTENLNSSYPRRRSSFNDDKPKSIHALNRYSERFVLNENLENNGDVLSNEYLSIKDDHQSEGHISKSNEENSNVFGSFKDRTINPDETHVDVVEKSYLNEDNVVLDEKMSMSNHRQSQTKIISRSTELDFTAFNEKSMEGPENTNGNRNSETNFNEPKDEQRSKTNSKLVNLDDNRVKDDGFTIRPSTNTEVIADIGEDVLEERITKIMKEIENETDSEVVNRIETRISELRNNKDLMKDFEHFCRFILPDDDSYQESIALLTMFYHFLDKKNLLK